MVIVRLVSLPLTVKGVTVKDADDNFNVFVNDRLSFGAQQTAYLHELRHIQNNDFYSQKTIQDIEGLK